MSNIAIRSRLPMPAGLQLSPAQWRVLTDAIFPSAKTAESISLALDYCAARKLDVFKRPVNIVPMWNNTLNRMVETVWPGVNEVQVTASRTGEWCGMDEPVWGPLKRRTFTGSVGHGQDARNVTVSVEFPEWCAVTVYRNVGGQKCAFTEPVFWEESYGRIGRSSVPNDMWQRRKRGQLHKVAKVASLRAAFPDHMGNEYVAEEMEGQTIRDGGVVLEGHVEDLGMAQPEPPPEPPQRPRGRTWADLVHDITAALAGVTDLQGVVRIGDSDDVQKVLKHGGERVQAEVKAMLAEAFQKYQYPAEPTPEEAYDPETGEILTPS